MSFVVHDYKCHSCNIYELDAFVRRSEMHEVPCPECGGNMSILPCAPNLDWDSLAMGENPSPEALAHWQRKRKQQQVKEEKTKRDHGDYGKAPGA